MQEQENKRRVYGRVPWDGIFKSWTRVKSSQLYLLKKIALTEEKKSRMDRGKNEALAKNKGRDGGSTRTIQRR